MSKFPGPKLWAASNIPLAWALCTGNLAQCLLTLHETYGEVVRVAPKELSYISAEAWRDVLSHRQGHDEFAKANPIPLPNGVRGILQAKRADHSRFRRLLSHSFSEKGMREQQSTLQYYVDLLIDGLKKNAEKGSQDMTRWFNWATFDIIGKLSFGASFGCLEHWQTHPWIETIFCNVRVIINMQALKRLNMDSLSPLIISSKTRRLRIFNFKYSSDKIEERMKQGTERGDFWDNVLKHSNKGDGEKGMTVEEMKSNASNMVLAGSETTATLLSGCIYQLLRNPSAMAKITSEIRSAFSSSDEIDLFNVGKLKYTLAVLDETMRIYPPVPTPAARVVPKGGDTVAGEFLPEGTTISLPQYAAYHSSSNFAKPFEFHPERFLGAEEFKDDAFSVLQPFGIGPRNCIGRNLHTVRCGSSLRKFFTTLISNWTRRQAKIGQNRSARMHSG